MGSYLTHCHFGIKVVFIGFDLILHLQKQNGMDILLSKSERLSISTLSIWGWIILCRGGSGSGYGPEHCIVGYSSASMALLTGCQQRPHPQLCQPNKSPHIANVAPRYEEQSAPSWGTMGVHLCNLMWSFLIHVCVLCRVLDTGAQLVLIHKTPAVCDHVVPPHAYLPRTSFTPVRS